MLFGVVFIKKKKRTWWFWKSFTSYLHIRSTLEHNSNGFQKLQFRATTLVLYHCRKLVMWPPPETHWTDPDMYHYSYRCFFHLLVISNDISFFRYIQWTPKWALKAVFDISFLFFSDFLTIFGYIWLGEKEMAKTLEAKKYIAGRQRNS